MNFHLNELSQLLLVNTFSYPDIYNENTFNDEDLFGTRISDLINPFVVYTDSSNYEEILKINTELAIKSKSLSNLFKSVGNMTKLRYK